MHESYVLPDDPLLNDLLVKYEDIRLQLLELDAELFRNLKEIRITGITENSYISDKPFYVSSSFTKFRNDVIEAQRNFEIFENSKPITKHMQSVNLKKKVPFLSISFSEKDRDINDYFKNILTALNIEFETGERYSKDSISEKIKKRIDNSDIIIVIYVKRDELKDGGHTAPSWLINELAYAQGKGKDVIAVVEEGINDIAGLKTEKEIIYFKRANPARIMKATIKFLEALKEHGLV